ncbi:hypothetical protein M440DRAFT_1406775 [Trichoderma longibrachiatum ATCC 18648]|uniref:Uncharacterized protein n=1 Tax=Trichoderma longibrachiatum ATCC 18648 TaxID=983965 RepID=A0A2T4BPJ2_TRILO|nr:hypothetical protein M440DRAFT_1406775 [Trichoderma longibrachiatum ATCC 18648]
MSFRFVPPFCLTLTSRQAQAALHKSNSAVNACAAGDAAEGEEENDHSSTALALVREPLTDSSLSHPPSTSHARLGILV